MKPGNRNLNRSVLGLALLAFTACSDKSPQIVAAAPASPSAAPTAASTASLPPGLSQSDKGFAVSGPLLVEHQLDLVAQRDGVLAKLHSDVGARVAAGDLLAELDDRQLNSDLEAARAKTRGIEAELKSWQSEAQVLQYDFERAQKMWDAKLISLEQYEHAKYKAEEEQWDVKKVEQLLITANENQHALELELEKTHISAPFSGVLARRYVREGQQVSRGDRLFWITGDGPLRMRFTLPERFIGRVKRGQELPLTTPDLPGQNYRAKVVELSPVVDPSSSTFEVLVELEGSRGELRPGMDASVTLDNLSPDHPR